MKDGKARDPKQDPPHMVTVTFDPKKDPKKWSFDPKTTTLKHKGTITLQAMHGATWVFVSINEVPRDWPQLKTGNGKKITLEDTLVPPRQDFIFTVTVEDDDGCQYTSPRQAAAGDSGIPPIIINDG